MYQERNIKKSLIPWSLLDVNFKWGGTYVHNRTNINNKYEEQETIFK